MKNLLIVSHCILNNAAKVEQDEAELAEEYKIREELMQLILKKDVQLLQLPCPEFIMYGSQRWGHVKNQFQHPFYMEQCRKILEPVLLQLQEYAQHVEKFHVLGIVSVEGSPTVSTHIIICRVRRVKGRTLILSQKSFWPAVLFYRFK